MRDDERQRYFRHLGLPGFDESSYERILSARVLVVGAGGLGSPALLYLAAAGVGCLGIVDSEVVELSNLQRQILHATPDLGRPKIDSAAEKLVALNPGVEVVRHGILVDVQNADHLVADYDVIVAAVDNVDARYALNDACVRAGKPLVEAAVTGFFGRLMTILGGETACYRCVCPQPDGCPELAPPSGLPIFGPCAGVFGVLQSAEVLKVITGAGTPLTNRMLTMDLRDMTCATVELLRSESCPVCGAGSRPAPAVG